MTAFYTYNLPTEETFKYFEEGKWYKSNLQNITAKYSGDPYNNSGYWGSPKFPSDYIIMVTPDEWVEIEEPQHN